MTHKILVVDDEPKIVDMVRKFLESEGFAVRAAYDGLVGLELARAEAPDLVILDVMLPGLDGLEVLRRLRAQSDVPVIMLTARSEEIDRLLGLGLGADDYVTKPFSPREVVARVKAVLRRTRPIGPAATDPGDTDVLHFDSVSVDTGRREVRVGGIPAVLTALEFDLLVALAESPGRVFSRAQLLEKVWGYDFFGDERVVDVHIRGMRKALGDDATAPRLIGTVRSVGYKFLLDPIDRLTTEGAS